MSPHDLLDTALTSDPIDALTAIRELQHHLREQQLQHVITLRRHGANWGFIGRALGITRQAAVQRFGLWEQPTQT